MNRFRLFNNMPGVQHSSFSSVQVLAMDLRISARRGRTEVGETDSSSIPMARAERPAPVGRKYRCRQRQPPGPVTVREHCWISDVFHTVTHTPKFPERNRERQTGSSAFLPGFFAAFSVLHDLCHKIPYCLCGSILLLLGGVGGGAEGEACIIVSQLGGDCFRIYTVPEGRCCE